MAFLLFVVGTVIFDLCSFDSFVAYSSLLDCCGLVGFLFVCSFLLVFFFHLMLAGRQPFGVLRWFQWKLNLELQSSTNATTVAVANITGERGWRVVKRVFASFWG